MERERMLGNLIPTAAKFVNEPETGMGIREQLAVFAPEDFEHLHEVAGLAFDRPHLVFGSFKLEGKHREGAVRKLGNGAALNVDGGGANNRCYASKNATLIRGE